MNVSLSSGAGQKDLTTPYTYTTQGDTTRRQSRTSNRRKSAGRILIGLGSGCGHAPSDAGCGERAAGWDAEEYGRRVGQRSRTPNSKLRIQIESGAVAALKAGSWP